MTNNPGKVFQEDFTKSFSEYEEDISVDRLKDDMAGFKAVTNICDFIVYQNPCQYFFELKSYQGRTIPKKAFRENQLEGLLKKAKIDGAVPGFILNYRLAADDQRAYFVHISDIHTILVSLGRKSISIDDAEEWGIRMEGARKRTRYKYFVLDFLDKLMDAYTKE